MRLTVSITFTHTNSLLARVDTSKQHICIFPAILILRGNITNRIQLCIKVKQKDFIVKAVSNVGLAHTHCTHTAKEIVHIVHMYTHTHTHTFLQMPSLNNSWSLSIFILMAKQLLNELIPKPLHRGNTVDIPEISGRGREGVKPKCVAVSLLGVLSNSQ